MSDTFKLYSKYYDLIYRDKDYPAEVAYIMGLIKQFSHKTPISLLDLGSGSGKHGILLSQQGLTVTGIEKSSEMVALANRFRNDNFYSKVGDITTFEHSESFDVVTALFHVLSYINSNQDMEKVFQNVKSHLNETGLFIFDIWYSPAVYELKPETRVKRIVTDEAELTRIAEPVIHHNQNIVDVNYHIFIKNLNNNGIDEIREVHSMRHYSIPELKYIAEKNNFTIIKTEEFMTGNAPSDKTWGITIIMRKNE